MQEIDKPASVTKLEKYRPLMTQADFDGAANDKIFNPPAPVTRIGSSRLAGRSVSQGFVEANQPQRVQEAKPQPPALEFQDERDQHFFNSAGNYFGARSQYLSVARDCGASLSNTQHLTPELRQKFIEAKDTLSAARMEVSKGLASEHARTIGEETKFLRAPLLQLAVASDLAAANEEMVEDQQVRYKKEAVPA